MRDPIALGPVMFDSFQIFLRVCSPLRSSIQGSFFSEPQGSFESALLELGPQKPYHIPGPPNVPLLRALWSLLDGI